MPPSIEPMRAAGVTRLPEPRGRQLAYEPKWDGWRCVARVTDDVVLHSRQGRNLTPYFPDVVRQLAHLPPGVVVDGELVVWDADRGRTSFTALQRRITAGGDLVREAAEHPAHLVVFDLLADPGGASLTAAPLRQRRTRLEKLLAAGPPQLLLCPQTRDADEARRWLAEWSVAGIEGLVIKDLAGRYLPGTAGWAKLKTRTTAEAVIGGFTGTPAQPLTLLLGRLDTGGRLRYVAHTHPLSAPQRRELAGLLPALAELSRDGAHPWPQPLPAAWTGRFDQREPLPYLQVQPIVVVEMETDTAYDPEHHRWRHPTRYLRLRAELEASDVSIWTPEGLQP